MLALGIGVSSALLSLGIGVAWITTRRQRRREALLTQDLLPLLDESGPIRQKVRDLLIKSQLLASATRQLRSSRERRIQAIRTLARLDGPEVVDPLLSQLMANDEKVREEAINALGALRDESALHRLLSQWRDQPLHLVGQALVRHGPSIICNVGPLVTNSDPVLRLWAVEVLTSLKAPEAIPFLTQALRDPQAVVRANAACALSEMPIKDLRSLIASLKKDPAPEVRVQAAESLMRIGEQEGKVALQEALLALGEENLPWDATLKLWNTLTRSLQRAGALEECLQRTSSMDAASFRSWLNIAVTAGDIRTIALVLRYAPHQSPEVSAGLGRALVTHGEPVVLQHLVQGLDSSGGWVLAAIKAMESLSLSHSAVAFLSAELGPLLQDATEEIRASAIALLKRWEVPFLQPEATFQTPAADQKPDGVKNGYHVEQVLLPGDQRENGACVTISNGNASKPRVLLVDDNWIFRLGLRSLLGREGLEVAHEARTIEEAEWLLPQLLPGVIVFCSTGLPGSSAFLKGVPQGCPTTVMVPVVDGQIEGQGFPGGLKKAPACIARNAPNETVVETIRWAQRNLALVSN